MAIIKYPSLLSRHVLTFITSRGINGIFIKPRRPDGIKPIFPSIRVIIGVAIWVFRFTVGLQCYVERPLSTLDHRCEEEKQKERRP